MIMEPSGNALPSVTSEPAPNEKRLNEAFHEAFALPVFAWLREQRLRLARQLLSQTDTPIADIAAHCGYGSPANFATAFRDRFECTPRDFRRRLSQRDAQTTAEAITAT